MLRALADEHVDRAIVKGLRKHGADVVTAQEQGLDGLDDEALLAAAAKDDRLILTNDKDFLAIHAKWVKQGHPHTGIVFWEMTKYSVGNAIRRIMGVLSVMKREHVANRQLYL